MNFDAKMSHNQDQKFALIFGGCGRRSQPTVQRLLQDNYTVVIVDNLRHSQHPKDWKDPTIWENQNLVFYEEDAVKFMNEENMFSLIKWSIVIHRAKVKSDDFVDEVTANVILDATFFRWINKLTEKPPIIIANQDSQLARDLTRHLQLPFQPAFL